MTTAEALQALTDPGKFELLAGGVLRSCQKDYQAIILSGVNAKGKTVKSPVDAFCMVPGSTPPRFVLVQHTTEHLKRLERKWLYDHEDQRSGKSASPSEDGDLVKAGHQAEDIRKEFSNAEFVVVLTTNQRPSKDMMIQVYKKAEDLGLTLDVWEQSRIAHSLDCTGEGQWLRREYLGIEADLLSRPLLRTICGQNFDNYERELSFADAECLVARDVEDETREQIEGNRYSMQFLVGESGFGKSTTAYRLLRRHLDSEGYGIWLPAQLIEESLSLPEALDKLLRSIHPDLAAGAGGTALDLIERSDRFVILADDINRTSDPVRVIRKLVAWSKPLTEHKGDVPAQLPPYVILCPVWTHIWTPMGRDLGIGNWANTIHIGPMTEAEGALAVQALASAKGVSLTTTEATGLAAEMGNDPILVGLFGEVLKEGETDLNGLARNALQRYLTSRYDEAAGATGASHLAADFETAVRRLGLAMLTSRRLQPSWEEIKAWFEGDSETQGALRELIQAGTLCRLTERRKLLFRHDRIRDVLLAQSILQDLESGELNEKILGEPFYAEIVARAITLSEQNKEVLRRVRELLPLALFEAVRLFGNPTSDYHRGIVSEAKAWVEETVLPGQCPRSVMDAVCWSLANTDSTAVLEISENLKEHPMAMLARLRNGDAASGARYCVAGNWGFEPSLNYRFRDEVIEQAEKHHNAEICRQIKSILESRPGNDETRDGALRLAGFLGSAELEDAINACWVLTVNKRAVVASAIWAGTRCCGANPARLLDPAIAYLAELGEEKDGEGHSAAGRIAEELRFALGRGVRPGVSRYLAEQRERYDTLRWPIVVMCTHIDEPDTIEFITRSAAGIERSIAGTEGFSPWVSTLTDKWDGSHGGSRRLSQESLLRLKELWNDVRNDKYVQIEAFRLWLTGTDWSDIETLRGIGSNSPLYRRALWKRVYLRDYSAVPEVLPILEVEDHWFQIADRTWCEKIMSAVGRRMASFESDIPKDFSGGRLNAHYSVSELLLRIPGEDAETLVVKHWDHIRYSPLFIQAALYVGTPKCLGLAASSIDECPRKIPVFQHVSHIFGFMRVDVHSHVTVQHLENLRPYFDRFGEFELWVAAEACQRLGVSEWSEEHIAGRLSQGHKKMLHPSEEDLLEELTELARDRHGLGWTSFWVEQCEKRHVPKDKVMGIIDKWLGADAGVTELAIAARCIADMGTRSDLSILEEYSIAGSANEVEIIKEDAKFSVYRRSLD